MQTFIIERKDGTSREVSADYYNVVNEVYFFYTNKHGRKNSVYQNHSIHTSFVLSVDEKVQEQPFQTVDVRSINEQVTRLQEDLEKLRGLSALDIVDYLNVLTQLDKPAMAAMFANRVPCNSLMARSKNTLVVNQHGGYYISLLEILNGLLMASGKTETIGYVFKDGDLSQFEVN